MSVKTEHEPSEEKPEEKELSFDECTVSDKPLEVVRTPGGKRYRLKFVDIGGDAYEEIAFRFRRATTSAYPAGLASFS